MSRHAADRHAELPEAGEAGSRRQGWQSNGRRLAKENKTVPTVFKDGVFFGQ